MQSTLKQLARPLWILAACGLFSAPGHAEQNFLPPRAAYKVNTSIAEDALVVRYDIEPGYYLYRDRLGFESATPGVTLGPPSLPVGEDHQDDYFGNQVIYRDVAKIGIPVSFAGAPRDFDLRLKLQGCADAGLCYPPQTWTLPIKWPGTSAAPAAAAPLAAKPRGGFNLRRLLGGSSSSDRNFLPPDRAFIFSASSRHADRITLRWEIEDEYYLYRDKVKIKALDPGTQLGTPQMPAGESKHDEYFGDQVIYRGELLAEVPVTVAAGTREVPIEVTYQGCADAGLCYPPIRKRVTVKLSALPTGSASASPVASGHPALSKQDQLAELIRSGSLLVVLGIFFASGLGLALTPCVWPMVPILSGIIVGAGGDKPVSRGRAFSLSVAYVLGMSVTYTIAGVAFAAAGKQAQAYFQAPWIIVLFAALFVWLALGMFGVFTLQLPAGLQTRIASLSNQQKQGTLLGTAIMGALSSLIVTACVTPLLVASLAVIGQSGEMFRGGAALFALSLGMGAPLLLVGASAGHLLPKAGPWMDAVKAVFGVVLLGVAIWMLGRVLPGSVTLALWAALAFVAGYWLLTMGPRESRTGISAVRRGFGALSIVYGVIMLVGALSGRSDPVQPLAGFAPGHRGATDTGVERTVFRRIKTTADLDREIAAAVAAGRPVMLDFYADWCASCKEMEKLTFTDAGVRQQLARAVLLQADVTANDAADQALLQRFGILGPPTIAFFGVDGKERPQYRVVGFEPADEFSAHVSRALASDGA
jgi:thiol:disulfide interchange protein DsbD